MKAHEHCRYVSEESRNQRLPEISSIRKYFGIMNRDKGLVKPSISESLVFHKMIRFMEYLK